MHVGTIGERAGVPLDVDQWHWSCGFYPGHHRYGTAATFDEARAGFEANWKALLPEIPVYAFEEYQHDRESCADINTIRARGEKLPSQIPSSLMRCVCGVTCHKPDESHDHRRHIYAVYYRTRAATSLSEGERKAQPICDFFNSPLISD